MNLSQRAIALCRMKYGKGELIGFEDIDNDILNDLTEDEEESVIRELAEAEFLESTDGNIHLGALAHHLLNMMIEPEQQIRIDNELNSAGLTVYIRNAYYLCVIDDKNITKADDPGKYTIELLPRLDLVVGAFTYVLGSITPEHDINKCLKISGRAWDKDRSLISEISLPDGAEDQPDVSSLINTTTMWMLENIAAGEHDTDIYEDQISDSPEV